MTKPLYIRLDNHSNQYYPFGMLFGESSNQDKQYYKYNGKELDQMHGLNQYDYAARYYDPGYGRFTSVDPMAEKFYSWSPYVYCYNNPLKFIDPDGREPNRNRAGTIDQAIAQWQEYEFKTISDLYQYLGGNEAIKYVYTENNGWIDLQHFAGTLHRGKLAMDALEPASGMGLLREIGFFNANSDKSSYSYEDLPSNQFAADFKSSIKGKEGADMFSAISDAFASAGATKPTSAANWEQIPFNEHERGRLPEKSTSIIMQSTAGAFTQTNSNPDYSLLKIGNYVPQNRTSKPYNLTNFPVAPTSIQRGNNRKGIAGW